MSELSANEQDLVQRYQSPQSILRPSPDSTYKDITDQDQTMYGAIVNLISKYWDQPIILRQLALICKYETLYVIGYFIGFNNGHIDILKGNPTVSNEKRQYEDKVSQLSNTYERIKNIPMHSDAQVQQAIKTFLKDHIQNEPSCIYGIYVEFYWNFKQFMDENDLSQNK
jgi:hypothetical protein